MGESVLLGTVPQLDLDQESWVTFVERFKIFVTVNSVDEKKHAGLLLTTIGPQAFALLRDLCAPKEPHTLDFESIVTILSDHWQPKPSEISERYRFHQAVQTATESVSEFLAKLRKLATHCNFGNALETTLRDRFVVGLRSEQVRKLLLAETELTLDKAVKKARSNELATRDASAIGSSAQPEPDLHAVKSRGQLNRTKKPASSQSQSNVCFRCLSTAHQASSCPFVDAECYTCKKRGHIAKACRQKPTGSRNSKRRGGKDAHTVEEQSRVRRQYRGRPPKTDHPWSTSGPFPADIRSTSGDFRSISGQHPADFRSDHPRRYGASARAPKSGATGGLRNVESDRKMKIMVEVNENPMEFEFDTGACVTIVSKSELPFRLPLQRTNRRLVSASGHLLHLAGEATVKVRYGSTCKQLKLCVAREHCPALFGRSWIRAMFGDQWLESLKAGRISTVSSEMPQAIKSVVARFEDKFFAAGLGLVNGFKAHLELKAEAVPRFHRARQVPYALQSRVAETLDRMEREGQLEKVSSSDWSTPIVPIVKPDQTIRICGDYKATVNAQLAVAQHPMPRAEDCFHAMCGGKFFSRLDLAQAYNQIPLDDESKVLTTINTHKGLYRWLRLPFGISSSPAIFQKIMDKLLNGLEGVVWYLDDILISGRTEAEHCRNLEKVLSRLSAHGFRGRKDKCSFYQRSVQFLGHVIDQHGVRVNPQKVRAIVDMKAPTCLSELQTFMGMSTYYADYMRDYSTMTAPLNELRQKDVAWRWGKTQQKAFEAVKQSLLSSDVLVHYDPKLKLKLDCDASSVGVGVVLSHIMPDGRDRPISFASKSLSASERNWSQIEKEAYAIIFGIKKFHKYLYGSNFRLVTDHRPLTTIFSTSKGLPAHTVSRLQRWAVFLMSYQYDIEYRSTQKHANCDTLSRLPLMNEERTADEVSEALEVSSVQQLLLDSAPVDHRKIASETSRDSVLSRVQRFIRSGWPATVSTELKPYFTNKDQMVEEQGCLLWGSRVLVPRSLQSAVLRMLHATHCGMVRTKALARSLVWWPKMDKAIEDMVGRCVNCQTHRQAPKRAPPHPLEPAVEPWERVHVDFAGPFLGKMWLVIVDAFSKWPEIIPMTSTSAKATIAAIRSVTERFGLFKVLMSDNGPQFTSQEFAEWLRLCDIVHITSAPYSPASNGQAERFVRTFKDAMKSTSCCGGEGRDLRYALSNFLLIYRSTPHALTGKSPAELMLNRRIRTRLDLLKPSKAPKSADWKSQPMEGTRCFQVGDSVWVKNFRNGKWVPGVITGRIGNVMYYVEVDGQTWRKHVNQIHHRPSDQADLDPPISPERGNSPVPSFDSDGDVDDDDNEDPPTDGNGTPNATPEDPADGDAAPNISRDDGSFSESPKRPTARDVGTDNPRFVRRNPPRDGRRPPDRYGRSGTSR